MLWKVRVPHPLRLLLLQPPTEVHTPSATTVTSRRAADNHDVTFTQKNIISFCILLIIPQRKSSSSFNPSVGEHAINDPFRVKTPTLGVVLCGLT